MPAQQAIRRWFDRNYASLGLSYLRPAEFYSIFLDYLDVQPGDRLLDVGCGPGLLLERALERELDAHGVDLSVVALSMARRAYPRARLSACNAESLCYPTGSFDHLTCIGVFEHCLDPDRTLSEMKRVLRPHGRLCIMVPNSRTLKWRIEADLLRQHDEDSNENAATFEAWRDIFLRNDLLIEQIHRDEWPRHQRWRWLHRRPFGYATTPKRHLAPLRYANQFVFVMRPG